jgi:ankyrin repeat protein
MELLRAAFAGDTTTVKMLLTEKKLDANQVGKNGKTALTWASEGGHTAVVEVLLREGKADANQADKIGITALMRALGQGDTALVQVLLREGKADANQANRFGETALMAASALGHTSVVELLVREGSADINQTSRYGRTALITASGYKHAAIVEFLFREGNAGSAQAQKAYDHSTLHKDKMNTMFLLRVIFEDGVKIKTDGHVAVQAVLYALCDSLRVLPRVSTLARRSEAALETESANMRAALALCLPTVLIDFVYEYGRSSLAELCVSLSSH